MPRGRPPGGSGFRPSGTVPPPITFTTRVRLASGETVRPVGTHGAYVQLPDFSVSHAACQGSRAHCGGSHTEGTWMPGAGTCSCGRRRPGTIFGLSAARTAFFTHDENLKHCMMGGGGNFVLVGGARHQPQVKPATDERPPKIACSGGANVLPHPCRWFRLRQPALRPSVGATGREPSMEFQMRNKTFISSMLGIAAAAAVAVAGSASAAVVSLFDFTTGVSNDSTGSVTGSNPLSTWLTENERKGSTTSATGSGGAITMASASVVQAGGSPLAAFGVFAEFNPNPPYNYYSSVDLSGATAIEFNVTAYSGVATTWNLYVFDENGNINGASLTVSSAGTKSFSTAFGDNIDWSKVVGVELQAESGILPPAERTPSNYYGTFSFTFDGMNAVGVVPAPGALALLGVAGLVGARRRRA